MAVWSDRDLQSVRNELEARVRDRPEEGSLHRELFTLYAMLGEWDRCMRRLEVVQELEIEAPLQTSLWSRLVAAEKDRIRVFSGEITPQVFGQPEAWIGPMAAAIQLGATEPDAAAKLRDDAFDQAPTTSGVLTAVTSSAGTTETIEFDWIADADGRLGPILEGILDGQYYWIPFQHIKSCALDEPTEVLDTLWIPATFEWTTGGETSGFIPGRYAILESASDELRMVRTTAWTTSDGTNTGIGQRMIATDVDDFGILAITKFDSQ